MPKVLIVEDDEVIAQGMARHLAAAGFDPVQVGNGTQGLARLRYEKPDVCVLDLMLRGVDADGVPPALPARARPWPRRDPRRAAAEAVGPARVAPRSDGGRLRPPP